METLIKIFNVLLLLLIIYLWGFHKWIPYYRLLRRKRYKRSLTKKERRLNKIYRKLKNNGTDNT